MDPSRIVGWAYCHKSKRTLTFSPHRISEIESTDKTFKPPADFMDGFLADAFDGMQSVGEKSQVKLRIGKDAPKFVHERVWSEREVRSTDKDGNTIVRFETPALFALEREILADAGWVENMKGGHWTNNGGIGYPAIIWSRSMSGQCPVSPFLALHRRDAEKQISHYDYLTYHRLFGFW